MKSIYLLYGEERYLIRSEIKRIQKLYPSAEIETLEDPSPQELIEKISLPALFAPQRMLILMNFSFAESERLSKALADLPPDLVLVFDSPSGTDRRHKSFKIIEELAEVIECRSIPEWQEDKLIEWVIDQARQENKRLSPDAAELLIEFSGRNLGLLAAEIEKLSIYLKDREEIKAEDIRTLTSRTGYDAFTLAEAIREGDSQQAFAALKQLFDDREDMVKLLGLLSSQVRNLYKTKLLKEQKLNQYQVAQALKTSPYFIGKLYKTAERFSRDELEEDLKQLYQTDLNLKSGFDPKTEMYLLLTELIGEKR